MEGRRAALKGSAGWRGCAAINCLRCGWFHPWAPGREHRVPLDPGARDREKVMVWAEGGRTLTSRGSTDFHTVYGFRRPTRLFGATRLVCGLDYPFTVPRKIRGLGAARLVSTPSLLERFRPGLARDCHVTGFPEFGQFCIAGFPASTQASLSPLRLPVPPRPHGWLRIFVYHRAAERTAHFRF